jgi:hypothetical protein
MTPIVSWAGSSLGFAVLGFVMLIVRQPDSPPITWFAAITALATAGVCACVTVRLHESNRPSRTYPVGYRRSGYHQR